MRRLAKLTRAAFALSLASCSSGLPPVAALPEVKDADAQQATCKVAKDPLNPLIVEWPGTNKVALDSASQKSVVVVSYVGCVLKVLASCQAGGSYEFKGVTPVRDKVSIENESELYARLPLGVASLKAVLASSGRLDLDYVAIGQREAGKPPVTLQGSCEGATHYIRTIMIGAYGLDAISKSKAGVSADIADRGVGGEAREGVRRLRGSGDVAKCSSGSAKPEDCGAVLQLGLAPLMVGGGGAVTAAGFGAGLGAVTVVPSVQEITSLPGEAQSLAAADVALLRLLQSAKRADKASAPFGQKATTWDALARYEGKNPYKEMAEKRREEWQRAAEAEERRKEQVAKVCAQYKADSAKLGDLLALDDEVVSAKQKAAYKKELSQVYAPYKAALDECGASGGPSARSGTAAASGAPASSTFPDGQSRSWEGSWSAPGQAYTFVLTLRRSGKSLEGQIQWHSVKTGADGRELVRGTWAPEKTEISVAGYDTSGPVARDTYVIKVLEDGAISGKSLNNTNDWSGRLNGKAR